MKKFLTVVLSASMLFVFSALMFAQEKGSFGMGEMGCGMDGQFMMYPKMVLSMASELNLTSDQMDKIKKISDEKSAKEPSKDEMKSSMESMKSDMEALKAEMDSDAPDQAKIDSMIDKTAEKMAEDHKTMMKNRVHTELAVKAVLTKDQKEILKKKMEEKKENMKNGKMKGMMKDKSK
jgi:Spy/CpxP family protein refolding chaperone